MTPPLPGNLALLRIQAHNPARAASFYAALFGWTVGATDEAGVHFTTPGGLRGVFRAGEPSTGGPHVYVRVGDLAAAIARACALGGQVAARPGPGPDGARVALVVDTEGNLVGMLEP